MLWNSKGHSSIRIKGPNWHKFLILFTIVECDCKNHKQSQIKQLQWNQSQVLFTNHKTLFLARPIKGNIIAYLIIIIINENICLSQPCVYVYIRKIWVTKFNGDWLHSIMFKHELFQMNSSIICMEHVQNKSWK
jgi:hypothetical protein